MQIVAVVELHSTGHAQSEGTDREAALKGDHGFESSYRCAQEKLSSHDGQGLSCHSIEHMHHRLVFILEKNKIIILIYYYSFIIHFSRQYYT